MQNKTIYVFWEPKANISPYLRLCMNSWKPFVKGFEVVMIDFSNVFEFIPADSLPLDKVKHVPLSILKDAIQSAVLRYNGGVFLDADMIITGDINPYFQQLDEYDSITVSFHLAFMMARSNSRIVKEWHEEVIKRIEQLKPNAPVPWDYFGNQILNPKFKSGNYNTQCIDKYKCAFTPETNYFLNRGNVESMYAQFWFSEKISLEHVFFKGQSIIALHNSWTPSSYQKLGEAEILAHPSLLSRTLARLQDETSLQSNKYVGNLQWLTIKFFWLVKAVLRKLKLSSNY